MKSADDDGPIPMCLRCQAAMKVALAILPAVLLPALLSVLLPVVLVPPDLSPQVSK